MESHWFINHGGQHVDLPEQFVNDCAWSENVHACDGGESAIAAKVIIDNFKGRIPTRDAYGGEIRTVVDVTKHDTFMFERM